MTDIHLLTADDMDRLPDGDAVIVLAITRDEIESHNIGSSVERLMELSDNPVHARRFCDALATVVQGYDFDCRELIQIPEVRRFFAAIDAIWPYFGYFGSEASGDISRMLAMLTPCDSQTIDGKLAVFIEPSALARQVDRWTRAIDAMADYHGSLPSAAGRRAMLARLAASLR